MRLLFCGLLVSAAALAQRGLNSSIGESIKKSGLRLEPRKAPVEVLVIDHIERSRWETEFSNGRSHQQLFEFPQAFRLSHDD
jgi:hypothetical protein